MASSTTAGVSQPPTVTVVTAMAGATAADDRFDPFLPAFEPAVDELSLQQMLDVNKESLKRRLQLRRSVAELAEQGIYPPLNTPPAFAEQRKQLEMAKTGDLLRKKLTSRPDRQCLVQHHILEDTNPLVDVSVQERQRQLKRCRLQENLSDHLVHRPGPLDLVHANILQLDPELFGADIGTGEDDSDIWNDPDDLFQDDSYKGGSQSSQMPLVAGAASEFMPLYDQDDVFSPISSTSSSGLSIASASATQSQQDIPLPPDILPLLRSSRTMSANEQPVSRVPTPPDITPLLRGALSSANIQLPLVSAQASSATSTPATARSSSNSRSNVSKKSRPKFGTKSKFFKFHQYFGPKNLQQQLEPCASSSPATADTPFNILVQQQQMLLRWQLEFQQKNMQFLLSVPSNDPPKPAPAKLAVSTPSPQPTSVNIAAKPSPSVAPVSSVQAAKRSRLEEMKVTDLRDECRRLNIARSGLKPVLIERLLPYVDDILSGNRQVSAAENSPSDQFDSSPCSVTTTPTLGISDNDASTDANILFIKQPARMVTAEPSTNAAISRSTSAVPMDVDNIPCKQEPTSPDTASPNMYPVMFLPASNNGHVVQASVSSTVPPLIVFRPTAQPVMRPAVDAAKQFPRMPPLLQEQILLEQQRHINELEHHLQLSQQKLQRAQHEAEIQRILHSDMAAASSPWVNNAALNSSSLSTSVTSVNAQQHSSTIPQLQRTNSLLDTSLASAFNNKLRRTMTSPYISTTADMAFDFNCRSLSSFAAPVHESLSTVRNGTIDDVLDVLISSGDLPASAVDTFPSPGSQVATTDASSCPLYFQPDAVGNASSASVQSHVSASTKHLPAGTVSDSMEWYSGDSNARLQWTTADNTPRISMLDPTDLVDLSGLLPKSSTGSDLGSVDMTDWLDDILQPGCGLSSTDYMNLADDCDLCSPADGVRATFEKLMEVTTSKS